MLPSPSSLVYPSQATVGLYDPAANTFVVGPSVGAGDSKYVGGVLTPSGLVVFGPWSAATVGIYDPGNATQPAYTLSQPLPASWNAALLPYYMYNKF